MNRTPRANPIASRPAGGFTLVELLTIIVILGMLITLASPSVLTARRLFKIEQSRGVVNMVAQATEQFRHEVGAYPPSDGGTPVDEDGDQAVERWPTFSEGRYALVQALTGYAPATEDWKDGPGFRAKRRGRVHGPYFTAGEQTSGDPPAFVDAFGNDIYYYRYTAAGYVASHNTDGPDVGGDYLRDPQDNFYRKDYVLLTRGPDRRWADVDSDTMPDDVDDIANFSRWAQE